VNATTQKCTSAVTLENGTIQAPSNAVLLTDYRASTFHALAPTLVIVEEVSIMPVTLIVVDRQTLPLGKPMLKESKVQVYPFAIHMLTIQVGQDHIKHNRALELATTQGTNYAAME